MILITAAAVTAAASALVKIRKKKAKQPDRTQHYL